MRIAHVDLRRAVAGARPTDPLRPRVVQQGRQGGQGTRGLHGRDPAHDQERDLYHQWHGAGRRLATAPFARRVLRPRQGQDPLVRKDPLQRADHPRPRLLARLRVRPQGRRVRPHRPQAQTARDHHPACARLHIRGHPGDVLRQERIPRQTGRILDGPGPGAVAGRCGHLRRQGLERRSPG